MIFVWVIGIVIASFLLAYVFPLLIDGVKEVSNGRLKHLWINHKPLIQIVTSIVLIPGTVALWYLTMALISGQLLIDSIYRKPLAGASYFFAVVLSASSIMIWALAVVNIYGTVRDRRRDIRYKAAQAIEAALKDNK